MPLKVNQCSEQVAANRGRVCFSRGPIVMCAEGVDNGGAVQRFYVGDEPNPDASTTQTITDGPLKGLPTITIPVSEVRTESETAIASS